MSKSAAITSKLAARLAAKGIQLSSQKAQEIPPPPSNDDEPPVKKKIILSKEESKFTDEFNDKLPPGWEKHFSPKDDTWYYWDLLTDRVSWLPPTHEYHEPQLTRKENDFSSLKANTTGVTLPPGMLAQKNKVKEREKSKSSGKDLAEPTEPETATAKVAKSIVSNEKLAALAAKVEKAKHQPVGNEKVSDRHFSVNPMTGEKRRLPPPSILRTTDGNQLHQVAGAARSFGSNVSFTDQGYGSRTRTDVNRDTTITKFDPTKLRKGHEERAARRAAQIKQRKQKKDEIDPMDPASYSDAPNTKKWGTGCALVRREGWLHN